MGQKHSRPDLPDDWLRTNRLPPHRQVDARWLKSAIRAGVLAPCYPPFEDEDWEALGLEECPICFLAYPALNRTNCCSKGICTECYLHVMPPLGRPQKADCPYCKGCFGARFRGPQSAEEREAGLAERRQVEAATQRARGQSAEDASRLESHASTSSSGRGRGGSSSGGGSSGGPSRAASAPAAAGALPAAVAAGRLRTRKSGDVDEAVLQELLASIRLAELLPRARTVPAATAADLDAAMLEQAIQASLREHAATQSARQEIEAFLAAEAQAAAQAQAATAAQAQAAAAAAPGCSSPGCSSEAPGSGSSAGPAAAAAAAPAGDGPWEEIDLIDFSSGELSSSAAGLFAAEEAGGGSWRASAAALDSGEPSAEFMPLQAAASRATTPQASGSAACAWADLGPGPLEAALPPSRSSSAAAPAAAPAAERQGSREAGDSTPRRAESAGASAAEARRPASRSHSRSSAISLEALPTPAAAPCAAAAAPEPPAPEAPAQPLGRSGSSRGGEGLIPAVRTPEAGGGSGLSPLPAPPSHLKALWSGERGGGAPGDPQPKGLSFADLVSAKGRKMRDACPSPAAAAGSLTVGVALTQQPAGEAGGAAAEGRLIHREAASTGRLDLQPGGGAVLLTNPDGSSQLMLLTSDQQAQVAAAVACRGGAPALDAADETCTAPSDASDARLRECILAADASMRRLYLSLQAASQAAAHGDAGAGDESSEAFAARLQAADGRFAAALGSRDAATGAAQAPAWDAADAALQARIAAADAAAFRSR